MTVVADVLAQFRADASDFNSGVQSARGELNRFEKEAEATAERLTHIKDAAGIAATAVGGAFTAALVTGIDIAKNYVTEIEQMQTSYTALLGSTGAASNQINQIEKFASSMGIATGQVGQMSSQLAILTQNQHNSLSDWSAFANEAAALGTNVNTVADAFGRAYELMQRQGGTPALATRSLMGQGLISPEVANQVNAMAEHGATVDQIWKTLVGSTTQYAGAADRAATSMKGLVATFHDLLDRSVGEMFTPLVQGAEQFVSAIDKAMQSQGFESFVNDLGNRMDTAGKAVSGLASHITTLFSSLNASSLDEFASKLNHSKEAMGALTGAAAEFGSEFIGKLPILNRFAGPFISFLDNGRGTMLGFVLASEQGRKALEDFVGATLHLIEAVAQTGMHLNGMLTDIGHLIAFLVEGAAGIINFVASNKQLLSVFEGVIGTIVTIVALDSAFKKFWDIKTMVMDGIAAIKEWIANFGQQRDAEMADLDVKTKQTAAIQELVTFLRQQTLATDEAAAAQERLNTAATSGVSASTQAAQQSLARTANIGDAAAASLGNVSMMPYAMGAMLGGGAMLAGAQATHGTLRSGLNIGGAVLGGAGTGAMVGSMIAPEFGGTAIGAVVGGVAGLATSLIGLASNANNAADALAKIQSAASSHIDAYNKAAPVDNTDVKELQFRAGYFNSGPASQSALQSQIDKDKADLAQIKSNLAYLPTGAGNQPEINSLKSQRSADNSDIAQVQKQMSDLGYTGTSQNVAKQSADDLANAQKTLNTISRETGTTFDQVSAKAMSLGLDLTTMNTSTQKGASAFNQLVAAMMPVGQSLDIIDQNTYEQITAFLQGAQSAVQYQQALDAVASAQTNYQKLLATNPQLPVIQATDQLKSAQLQQRSAQLGIVDAQRAYNDSVIGSVQQTINYASAILKVQQAQLGARDAAAGVIEAQAKLNMDRQSGASTLQVMQDENAYQQALLSTKQSTIDVTQTKHDLTYMQQDIASGRLQAEAQVKLQQAYLSVKQASDQVLQDQQQLSQAQIDAAHYADNLKASQDSVTASVVSANSSWVTWQNSLGTLSSQVIPTVIGAMQQLATQLGPNSAVGQSIGGMVGQLTALQTNMGTEIVASALTTDMKNYQALMDQMGTATNATVADQLITQADTLASKIKSEIGELPNSTQWQPLRQQAANMIGQPTLASMDVGGYVGTDQLIRAHANELVLPLSNMAKTNMLLGTFGLGASAPAAGPMTYGGNAPTAGPVIHNTKHYYAISIDHVENFDDLMSKMDALQRTSGLVSTSSPQGGVSAYGG